MGGGREGVVRAIPLHDFFWRSVTARNQCQQQQSDGTVRRGGVGMGPCSTYIVDGEPEKARRAPNKEAEGDSEHDHGTHIAAWPAAGAFTAAHSAKLRRGVAACEARLGYTQNPNQIECHSVRIKSSSRRYPRPARSQSAVCGCGGERLQSAPLMD